MADNENALSLLLQAGLKAGTDYATDKLYGSKKADQRGMEEERARFNSINGNGPVNQAAALERPNSWTEFFFGAPPSTGGALGETRRPPLLLIVAVVVVVGWFIWKKA